MTDLKNKVIIVTGASYGIGAAIARALVEEGAKVVGCARSVDKLKNIEREVNNKERGSLFGVQCDVTKEEDILNVFKVVEEKFGSLHGIVNNAGIISNDPLLTGRTENWMRMLQVNVLAVAIFSREAVKMMKKFGDSDGHIVNINSISGHVVTKFPIMEHFYCATKYAVTAITEGLKLEIIADGCKFRVTAISPGFVKTKIFDEAAKEEPEQIKELYDCETLDDVDISGSVVFVMKQPPRVNISDILIRSNVEAP